MFLLDFFNHYDIDLAWSVQDDTFEFFIVEGVCHVGVIAYDF